MADSESAAKAAALACASVPRDVAENNKELLREESPEVSVLDPPETPQANTSGYFPPPDVQLISGDNTFGAHKTILSEKSSVFKEMFKGNKRGRRLKIEKMDRKVVEQMLRFIYTGSYDVECSTQVIDAAEKYDIQGLKSNCVDHIMSSLSNESALEDVVEALGYGKTYNSNALCNASLQALRRVEQKSRKLKKEISSLILDLSEGEYTMESVKEKVSEIQKCYLAMDIFKGQLTPPHPLNPKYKENQVSPASPVIVWVDQATKVPSVRLSRSSDPKLSESTAETSVSPKSSEINQMTPAPARKPPKGTFASKKRTALTKTTSVSASTENITEESQMPVFTPNKKVFPRASKSLSAQINPVATSATTGSAGSSNVPGMLSPVPSTSAQMMEEMRRGNEEINPVVIQETEAEVIDLSESLGEMEIEPEPEETEPKPEPQPKAKKASKKLPKKVYRTYQACICLAPTCGKWFPSKKLRDEHHQTHEHLFICYFCYKSSTSENSLMRHLLQHTREQIYVCSSSNCQQRFNTAHTLRRHKRGHIDFYVCQTCKRRVLKQKEELHKRLCNVRG